MGYIRIYQGIILILYLVGTYGGYCKHPKVYCVNTDIPWTGCIDRSVNRDISCRNIPDEPDNSPAWIFLGVFFGGGFILGIIFICCWNSKPCQDCCKGGCTLQMCSLRIECCNKSQRSGEEENTTQIDLDETRTGNNPPDNSTQTIEERIGDNPPDYSSGVNAAFISDNPRETQARIEDLPPSYSSVDTGEGITMHRGQLRAMYQPQPDRRSSSSNLEAAKSVNVKPVIGKSSEVTKRDEQQKRRKQQQHRQHDQMQIQQQQQQLHPKKHLY